jgi:soluble lytic murein transglycosylase-like protein
VRIRAGLLAAMLSVAAAGAEASPAFWREVSPHLGAGRPSRLAPAAFAAQRTGASNGSVQAMQAAARAHGPTIAAAARTHGVSEPLLLALVAAESGGNARAVSPKGAMGLGQLMPGTAERFGVRDPFDPAQNLDAAARYLSILLLRYGGDAVLALAAYNAGEGAVDRHRGVPPFPETRDYVPRVLGLWDRARRGCPRIPTGPRHPCPAAWGRAGG